MSTKQKAFWFTTFSVDTHGKWVLLLKQKTNKPKTTHISSPSSKSMPKEACNQNTLWCSVGWIKHGSPTSDLERGLQRCQSTGFKGWMLDWFTQSSDLFDMKTWVILIVVIHYPSNLASSPQKKKKNPKKKKAAECKPYTVPSLPSFFFSY